MTAMSGQRINIIRPAAEQLQQLGADSWPAWECDPGEFYWQYPAEEIAYVKQGRVIVTPEGGEPVEINAGDLVVFPTGMRCRWKVVERIEKVYKIG